MNETTPDQKQLLDEAIDLIIRLQNDSGNPVAIEMIRAWRARGIEYEEAWTRVAKVHGVSGSLLMEKRRIERRESLGLSRRNFMVGGLAVLGAGAAFYTFGTSLLLRVRSDFITAKGEIRRIDLPDGSVATMGPDSAIALSFSDERRMIHLLAGMSYFNVKSDPNRPFSVFAGSLNATALGTAFDVSSDAGVLSVSVDHGLVDVRSSDPALETGVELGQGQWVIFDPTSGSIARGEREKDQIASWRNNIVIAERETISALVARIGRWIPGRIVIADPSIGSQHVSGVFDLNNPLLALQAVVHPAGGHVRQISSLLTVVSSL
ncbi:FecR domain-containing protein [Brucella pseudogrignonensis]|jgi:transmembrane sensor|uniref:FecR family protein n=1 Tax=Brucella pseudogrignonensis TaxID=419475 RepID=UPI00190CAC9B|nr:FecR domain-containing protein [Brucella pseudogrignonensis]MBK0022849.1 FecR domain-containing protein [Ochrobactrum sp. S45]MBK0044864.1 FecR domain-containing protein [Ochrobactrum sp. S46]UKK95382.1 FecR domain-containing protein [Brucella pseudogrignonensis]